MKAYDITKLAAELKGCDNLRYKNTIYCIAGYVCAIGSTYMRHK